MSRYLRILLHIQDPLLVFSFAAQNEPLRIRCRLTQSTQSEVLAERIRQISFKIATLFASSIDFRPKPPSLLRVHTSDQATFALFGFRDRVNDGSATTKPRCETKRESMLREKMIMWSAGARLLRRTSSMSRSDPIRTGLTRFRSSKVEPETKSENIEKKEIAKQLRLVDVEKLLGKTNDKETIPYNTLLETSQSIGIATSLEEARAFARVLDDAEIVLLFRDKIYFNPDKVVEQIRKSATFALNLEDNPMKEEFNRLKAKKKEIDMIAHRQVRRILWFGLAWFSSQVGLFFRLTFWDFSWNVMAPITFFNAATQMIIGYAYFLLTSRDPTYEGLMKTLFFSRQRKLFRKYSFDIQRFKELERKC